MAARKRPKTSVKKPRKPPALRTRRLRLYRGTFGDVDLVEPDSSSYRIDVCTFGRDFQTDCEQGDGQEGYVLITNGMSDRRMAAPSGGTRRAELVWYTADASPEKLRFLSWLASVPFIDQTFYGFGHTMQLPEPPVKNCKFKKLLFLTPIITPDVRLAEKLSRLWKTDSFELLTVHVLSDAEHRFVRNGELGTFLDMLDDKKYPRRFNPKRKSYV